MTKRTIEDEMEDLARSIVRDAKKRTKGPDGKFHGVSMLDKARALKAAMDFLKERERRASENAPAEVSDFERDRELYDSEREGGTAAPTAPTNGTGQHTD